MELEGVKHNTPRVRHADDLEPLIPAIARSRAPSETEWAHVKKIPRTFQADENTHEITEFGSVATFPDLLSDETLEEEEEMLTYMPKAPLRTALRMPNEPHAKKIVHIDSRPSVHLADYAYDRSTAWGGETPHYSAEYRKQMGLEVEELRRELFPDGGAFGDRDVDYHDPTVARTACVKVHVVKKAHVEKFDATEWPTDDFY